ncbi:MAG: hypothetical protein BM557_01570 [Flavobacterium sp. MedPE-SWcel]|nr:MAG: hypothetical protein BM557_01570 [Flavobacterium sp. MedPE-SWcel]
MKSYLVYLIAILCFQTSIAQEKTLFIGNSMTYFNDMPNLFEEIANDKGKDVQVEFHAPGGTGFVHHHVNNTVYNLFENNTWDIVVLQPGTGESAGASHPVDVTIERGQQMIDSIKKYSPCAKIFLYEIPYGIKATNNVPDYNDYHAIQTIIRDSITKMANGLQIPFVPAGESARNHLNNQDDLLLHNGYNDVHPNLNGSYLVASTMYAAIYQEEVSVSNYLGGVTQENATYFQNIADEVVLPNKADWLINTYNLYANFTGEENSYLTVNFTNLSTNYDSLEWDFGDGTTSTEENPIHIFTTEGVQEIELKAIKENGCEEIIKREMIVGNLSTEDFDFNNFILYPNPVNDNLNLMASDNFSFKIINMLGQIVYKNSENKTEYTINLSHLESGIYYVITKNKEFRIIKN